MRFSLAVRAAIIIFRRNVMKLLGLTVLMVLMIAEAQAATCESLLTFSLPHTTVTLAQPIAAGTFSPPSPGAAGRATDCRLPGTASVLPRRCHLEARH
jgi:hypothetical protein